MFLLHASKNNLTVRQREPLTSGSVNVTSLPSFPGSPCGPGAPSLPSRPSAPAGPGSPLSPLSPFGPGGPSGPGGPGTTPEVGTGGSSLSLDVYSTEETRIGTWINGKPIYRKCFSLTTPPSSATVWYDETKIESFGPRWAFRSGRAGHYASSAAGHRHGGQQRLPGVKPKLSRLRVTQRGSVNVNMVQFEFSSDWDGLERTAVFRAADGDPVSVLLAAGDQCGIPWEVLSSHGQRISAGVCGTRGAELVLPTVWADLGAVQEGACPGEPSRPPTSGVRAAGRSVCFCLRIEGTCYKNLLALPFTPMYAAVTFYLGSDTIDPAGITYPTDQLRPGDIVNAAISPRAPTYGGTLQIRQNTAA